MKKLFLLGLVILVFSIGVYAGVCCERTNAGDYCVLVDDDRECDDSFAIASGVSGCGETTFCGAGYCIIDNICYPGYVNCVGDGGSMGSVDDCEEGCCDLGNGNGFYGQSIQCTASGGDFDSSISYNDCVDEFIGDGCCKLREGVCIQATEGSEIQNEVECERAGGGFYHDESCIEDVDGCGCIERYTMACGNDRNIHWVDSCGGLGRIVSSEVDQNPYVDFSSRDGNCALSGLVCGYPASSWIGIPKNFLSPEYLTCLSENCDLAELVVGEGLSGTISDGDEGCISYSPNTDGVVFGETSDDFGAGTFLYWCDTGALYLIETAEYYKEQVCKEDNIEENDYRACGDCVGEDCTMEVCENRGDCEFVSGEVDVEVEGILTLRGDFGGSKIFEDMPYSCDYSNVDLPTGIGRLKLVCNNVDVSSEGEIIGSSVSFVEEPDLTVEKIAGDLDRVNVSDVRKDSWDMEVYESGSDFESMLIRWEAEGTANMGNSCLPEYKPGDVATVSNDPENLCRTCNEEESGLGSDNKWYGYYTDNLRTSLGPGACSVDFALDNYWTQIGAGYTFPTFEVRGNFVYYTYNSPFVGPLVEPVPSNSIGRSCVDPDYNHRGYKWFSTCTEGDNDGGRYYTYVYADEDIEVEGEISGDDYFSVAIVWPDGAYMSKRSCYSHGRLDVAFKFKKGLNKIIFAHKNRGSRGGPTNVGYKLDDDDFPTIDDFEDVPGLIVRHEIDVSEIRSCTEEKCEALGDCELIDGVCETKEAPPSGDCLRCVLNPYGICDEYMCLSVGQDCIYESGTCYSESEDVDPVISLWEDRLVNEGYSVTGENTINSIVPGYFDLYFKTDEPVRRCEWALVDEGVRGIALEESSFLNVFAEDVAIVRNYMGWKIDLRNLEYNLEHDRAYQVEIVCEDFNGNKNDAFVVNLNTMEEIDTTPPDIRFLYVSKTDFAIEDTYNLVLYVSEFNTVDNTCKWSIVPELDEFDEMVNRFSCSGSAQAQGFYSGYYRCNTNIPVEVEFGGEVNVNVACRDRNSNEARDQFTIIKVEAGVGVIEYIYIYEGTLNIFTSTNVLCRGSEDRLSDGENGEIFNSLGSDFSGVGECILIGGVNYCRVHRMEEFTANTIHIMCKDQIGSFTDLQTYTFE